MRKFPPRLQARPGGGEGRGHKADNVKGQRAGGPRRAGGGGGERKEGIRIGRSCVPWSGGGDTPRPPPTPPSGAWTEPQGSSLPSPSFSFLPRAPAGKSERELRQSLEERGDRASGQRGREPARARGRSAPGRAASATRRRSPPAKGKGGGGSLGFYLRRNSLAEDCS